MPWRHDRKQQTRLKILESAGKLFTQQGYDQVSIDDIMFDAGMTRGAFYAHFPSKSALYAESITSIGHAAIEVTSTNSNECSAFAQFAQSYLSQEHREGKNNHCPLAFLVSDISRQEALVKQAYTQIFKQFSAQLNTLHDAELTEEEKLSAAAMLIGGLAVSRAINDETLADKLLVACKAQLAKLADNSKRI